MTIKLAFCGVGSIARVHAQAGRRLDDVELVAAVNHRPDSLAAFAADFSISRTYPAIQPLVADGDVDAVIVSTPNYMHAEESIAALEAGLAVLVEKPMAMNGREAAAMAEAVDRTNGQLMVAHNFRFAAESQWLRDQLQQQPVGQVVRTASYSNHVRWGPGGWFTQSIYAGGGALADMGVHAIDTTRFLLGDPRPLSVYARIGSYYGHYDVDDTAQLLINWQNGVTSYIESGWWQPHSEGPNAATRLYGAEGYASLFPTLVESADGQVLAPPPGPGDDMYATQMAAFVATIRHGRSPSPGVVEGLVNMQLIDAAYLSARTGEVVRLEGEG
jgi:predicted dehydrogenase